jgi:hypothetical protein
VTGIRLHFIVEGQTEETFVNQVLKPYLGDRYVWADARCVLTSRRGGVKYRGGFRSYAQPRRDILSWLKEDQNDDARFTTAFDVYRLPSDFPGYGDAQAAGDPYEKVRMLEAALHDDIGDWRFIPYLQLHEFETLLLSEPDQLAAHFTDGQAGIQNLVATAGQIANPELINDGPDTAPSKRIIAEIPEYAGMKPSAGPIVAEKIGLANLRLRCRHFGEWIDQLEGLAQ